MCSCVIQRSARINDAYIATGETRAEVPPRVVSALEGYYFKDYGKSRRIRAGCIGYIPDPTYYLGFNVERPWRGKWEELFPLAENFMLYVDDNEKRRIDSFSPLQAELYAFGREVKWKQKPRPRY